MANALEAKYHLEDADWIQTPEGVSRGYIQPELLRELWFHTGTACNLACPFCLEGSAPGNHRLEQVTHDEIRPFIDEALMLGVEQFSFTGGEPFINKDIFDILHYAATHRPCMVLTNGTRPVTKRWDQILRLREAVHPVRFRISLDTPDVAEHDAGRGAGNFELALETLGRLHDAGFAVSVARHMDPKEDRAAIESAFHDHFQRVGIKDPVNLVAFPDFYGPSSHPTGVPHITENCMTQYQTEETRNAFMCNFSKMVVKRNGKIGVFACTLVDDDDDYNLSNTLREAMDYRVMLRHHRCFSCFQYGASCSEC